MPANSVSLAAMNRPPETNCPRAWPAIALIACAAAVAYANTMAVPFVFDDIPAIVEHPAIRHFGSAVTASLTRGAGGLTLSGRPVFAFSLALNHAISGSAVWSYHLLNLLVHAAAGLALFGLLRRIFRALPRFTGAADRLALIAALLWTVHPLQTESVTYVVQRAESLAGLFYLLTLYAFVRATEKSSGDDAPPTTAWFAVSVVACALGMATKETMVTAPVVVWFYDRALVAGTFRAALRGRPRYYAALAATWLLLAFLIATTGGNRGGTVGFNVGVSPWSYAATQFEAVTRYLSLGLWPHPLVFEYGTFWVDRLAAILPYAGIVLAVLAATLVALRPFEPAQGRHRAALGFGGACFFGVLAPTSLTPGTIQMVVEHRMYLPLAAVLAVFVAAGHVLLARGSRWIFALVAAGFLCLTVERNADYRDERGLWALTVAQRPHNAIALANLGLAEFRRGKVADGVALYQRALRENPASVEAHYNLGVACAQLGRTAEAISEYESALRLRPGLPAAHNNLGNSLVAAGRPADAATHYREAARLDPFFAEPHHNLGNLLLQSDQPREAIVEFETALRLRPDYAEAHYDLGNAFAVQDRMADAGAHYEQAIRLQPAYADAEVNLGNALVQLDRLPEAVAHYEAALRLNPSLADAHNNLGLVFLHTGRLPEAIAHFEQAITARPAFGAARENLAAARAELTRVSTGKR
jgi:protein O-mannosyl-transferase